MLKDFFASIMAIQDRTRIGCLFKDGDDFVPQNDIEWHAKTMLRQVCQHMFDDRYSAFLTADKLKTMLDEMNEIYDPAKVPRACTFIRNKLKPAQIITPEWAVWFIRRFK